ncbi:hypothetical protein Dsin_024614 [Dipteronia sinensis]|uniref:Uncharacterized protein n=1 Tax=Dipteronia sinensis TaxID=43782 RepID=A0AAD9ZVE6_9ROSI|nr:hypothetical protein Dsin_024614 [Dipteronia sinensis]
MPRSVGNNAHAWEEEERIAKQLKEEIDRIRATMLAKKESPCLIRSSERDETKQGGGAGLDKEKMLKVSWEKLGTAERLRELFSDCKKCVLISCI